MLGASIGLDIGSFDEAAARAAACRGAGAAVARMRVGLGWRAGPDDELLGAIGAALDAVAGAGLQTLLTVDSDFTVAPDGLGAFRDPPGGSLAAAWEAEWKENLALLATAVGSRVGSWELLPEPNRGSPARIAPSRWAHLVATGARAVVDAAPGARVLPGGILCDGGPESEAYLAAALDAGLAADLAASAGPALLGALALRLAVAGDGGATEADVADACTAAADAHGRLAAEGAGHDVGLSVTGVTWRADRCGESIQARNLWAAFNALSARPEVDVVVWSSILDLKPGIGLYRGLGLEADERRPAWQTFNDFALYARQIAPPAGPHGLGHMDLAAAPEAETEAEAVPEPKAAPPTPEAQAEGPVPAAEAPSDATVVTIHVPSAAEVLASRGLAGEQLEGALAALREAYGDPASLGPGEYTVKVSGAGPGDPRDHSQRPPAAYTNQDVISAFYSVGGGTWDVFDRSGLSLGTLARGRREAYDGPPIESMDSLSAEERAAVLEALRASAEGDP